MMANLACGSESEVMTRQTRRLHNWRNTNQSNTTSIRRSLSRLGRPRRYSSPHHGARPDVSEARQRVLHDR